MSVLKQVKPFGYIQKVVSNMRLTIYPRTRISCIFTVHFRILFMMTWQELMPHRSTKVIQSTDAEVSRR